MPPCQASVHATVACSPQGAVAPVRVACAAHMGSERRRSEGARGLPGTWSTGTCHPLCALRLRALHRGAFVVHLHLASDRQRGGGTRVRHRATHHDAPAPPDPPGPTDDLFSGDRSGPHRDLSLGQPGCTCTYPPAATRSTPCYAQSMGRTRTVAIYIFKKKTRLGPQRGKSLT